MARPNWKSGLEKRHDITIVPSVQATAFPASPHTRFYSGVVESAVPWLSAEIVRQGEFSLTFLIARNLQDAERWLEELLFYWSLHDATRSAQVERLAFPDLPDTDPGDPRLFDHQCDRTAVLTHLLHPSGKPRLIATTIPALFEDCPHPQDLAKRELKLAHNTTHDLKNLAQRLGHDLGYSSEVVCEFPGQYALRGGILDVYPVNETRPYRIDFFGDEIESIRPFDPATQRSEGDPRPILIIASAQKAESAPHPGGILDYLQEPTRFILLEPEKLAENYPDHFFASPQTIHRHWGMFFASQPTTAAPLSFIGLTSVESRSKWFPDTPSQEIDVENLANYRDFPSANAIGSERFDSEQTARIAFLQRLQRWQRQGLRVSIVIPTDGEAARLQEILSQTPFPEPFKPELLRSTLRAGLVIHTNAFDPRNPRGWVIATDAELFGRHRARIARVRHKELPQKNRLDQALDFSELVDGDPLVHLQHGICIYRGLTQVAIRGQNEEAISLEFAEAVTIHLPLHESHLLTRYVGLSKSEPKLGKIGSGNWDKARQAAEKATLDLAGELLRLQAARDAEAGHAFPSDTEWQSEFEQSFIYRETPDQLTAIRETKADMERPVPMDRLICGDVGFGKTEVAIRAAFKAVNGGRQVAILVPTTVLCQQHYNTFKERMADYPVTVEMVSRFRSPTQNRAILLQVQAGKIDILIGTHRILSEDVHFRDLGLLIIDEEQRFGVRHKERLKQMRLSVDVLTLSATPIPRTLYMALVGAREMSVIETAPVDRLPIQTIVRPYDPNLIRSAIQQELNRGGQVFYLHNRVGSIDRAVGLIESLVPDARIGMGHGQMDEGMLERVMTKFVAHEYDILVCTTIIESGIDIPNCNTIIIENAERFGLSQLYQIRGRVGRQKRQAYAYLLTHKSGKIPDEARQRLSALRQYNKLGSGYRIAMRDLELRGAGNLLGAEQSGHIAGVGFDLYCQLLRQSVARLKGDKGADFIRAKVQVDCVIVGERGEVEQGRTGPSHDGFSAIKMAEMADERIPAIHAFIPDVYLDESRLRIDFYRRLALAEHPEDVRTIADEMKDRFGPLPAALKTLLHLTQIRTLAEHVGVDLVILEGTRLKCRLAQGGPKESYLTIGNRFPRVNGKNAHARLRDIKTFLLQQKRVP